LRERLPCDECEERRVAGPPQYKHREEVRRGKEHGGKGHEHSDIKLALLHVGQCHII